MTHKLVRKANETGLGFVVATLIPQQWLDAPGELEPIDQPLAAYLAQLEEEGYARRIAEGLTINWADLYDLLNHPEHFNSTPLLGLPEFSTLRPALVSQGALSDSGFSIYLDGWRNETGRAASQFRIQPVYRHQIPLQFPIPDLLFASDSGHPWNTRFNRRFQAPEKARICPSLADRSKPE